MLDHVFQVVGDVDAVGRHLHRFAVAVAPDVDAEHAQVDRPPVGMPQTAWPIFPGAMFFSDL